MTDNIDRMIRNNIMNILIECRKEKGVTQSELAKYLGLKPTTIASWEQGKSLPSIPTLYKLATYYNKSISYMYEEKNSHSIIE